MITAVLVAVSGEPRAEVACAAVLVLALAGAWLAVGRRLARTEAPPGGPAVLTYAALLVVALAVAVLLVPDSTWGLFALLPQMFWLLRLGPAIVVTVVLTLGLPLLAVVGEGGDPLDPATGLGPQTLFMTAFGVLVGTRIHRVTSQSDERARLIEELEASRER